MITPLIFKCTTLNSNPFKMVLDALIGFYLVAH